MITKQGDGSIDMHGTEAGSVRVSGHLWGGTARMSSSVNAAQEVEITPPPTVTGTKSHNSRCPTEILNVPQWPHKHECRQAEEGLSFRKIQSHRFLGRVFDRYQMFISTV